MKPDQAIKAVAEHYGLSIADLLSRTRFSARAAEARQALMWVLAGAFSQHGGLTAIGHRLGRDRTTVRHGIRAAERRGIPEALRTLRRTLEEQDRHGKEKHSSDGGAAPAIPTGEQLDPAKAG